MTSVQHRVEEHAISHVQTPLRRQIDDSPIHSPPLTETVLSTPQESSFSINIESDDTTQSQGSSRTQTALGYSRISVRPHFHTLTNRLTILVALIGEDSRDVSALRWTFVAATARGNPELVDLSSLLDEAVLQLRKDVPLQLVVDMFRKMVWFSAFNTGTCVSEISTRTES